MKFSMLPVEILSHVLVKLGRLFNGKQKHILETKHELGFVFLMNMVGTGAKM